VSVGAIEPQFYATLRKLAGIEDAAFDAQLDRDKWPNLSQKLAEIFITKSRDEWMKILEGSDACVAPVVSLAEAATYPHLAARDTFVEAEGGLQPAPAPRFSRTPSAIQHSANVAPVPVSDILSDWAGRQPQRSRA
jgi:alpha-methylacyl-CoA racemase